MRFRNFISTFLIPVLGASLHFGMVVALAGSSSNSPLRAEGVSNAHLRGLGISAKLGKSKDLDTRQLQLMQSLGVSVVVWTPGEWASNEKQRGQYSLDPEVRRVIQEMAADNMQTIVALFRRNDVYANPLDPAAFARYCEWIAGALKGSPVAAYQIWNEPSNFDFRKIYGGTWNGRGNAPWVDKFSELIHSGAQAIRHADPNAKIIASFDGPASIYAFWRHPQDFMEIDGLSLHPYSFKLPPEQVPYGGTAIYLRDGVSIADPDGSLQSTLRIQAIDDPEKYIGRTFDTWVTEYGFPTCDPASVQQYFACVSPEVQAAYHARALILGLAQGVKVWTPYELADEGQDPSDPEQNFGLTKNADLAFAPKPAFSAIQRIARILGSNWRYIANAPAHLDICNGESDCKPVKSRATTAGPQMFWFASDQEYAAFVWKAGAYRAGSSDGQLRWSVPAKLEAKVRMTELVTGTVLSPTVTSRKEELVIHHVPIGSSPVVLELSGQ